MIMFVMHLLKNIYANKNLNKVQDTVRLFLKSNNYFVFYFITLYSCVYHFPPLPLFQRDGGYFPRCLTSTLLSFLGEAIHFPLSAAFAASHKFHYTPLLFLSHSRYFVIPLVISFL